MRTADGVSLHVERVAATRVRRGVIVCLHAMMTDGRYFGATREDSFARELAAGGFDVLVPDFRGHGKSELRAGRDDWSFDDLVELDLPAIVAGAGCAASELVLLGHSLGGLVTAAALGIGAIPAPRLVVLASTNVWLGETPKRRALMSIYRGITRLAGKAPIRALRLGTADESATYVKQLTGWTRAGTWTSLRGIDYAAGLARVAAPVLPLVGAGDWMCTPSDARRFARQLPNAAPVRVVGVQHGDAFDPDHFQIFTKPALRPLWRDLRDRL